MMCIRRGSSLLDILVYRTDGCRPAIPWCWLCCGSQGQLTTDSERVYLMVPWVLGREVTISFVILQGIIFSIEALLDHSWPRDIQGGLSLIGLFEYFQLWDIIHEVTLLQSEDSHVWLFDASGQYSSKSAYKAFLNGKVLFEPWRRLWKSWAPAKCKVFLWLAIRNRCWTADPLARRGLPHPSQCPLCDQCDEDVQHLLTTCVFARQFWFKVFQQWGLPQCVPDQDEISFANWWRRAVKKVLKEQRKGLNSLIILGAWLLWKHRNSFVFEGASPSINNILRAFEDEHQLWCFAGARGLRALELGRVPESN